MTLDNNALVMPSGGGNFGRMLNGRGHQAEALVTHNGYQFAAWYRNGPDNGDIVLGRRALTGNTWESFDVGANLVNGRWDAHNTVNLGISGDGRIHLVYDHHGDNLRYLATKGTGTATGAVWNQSIFVDSGERSSFNTGGSTVSGVTYPRLINSPNGDLFAVYRTGGSGNGDSNIVKYNSATQQWNTPHQFVNRSGNYSDFTDTQNSTSRNAYFNGVDVGADGTLHATWTWRERTQGANHDIMYAYSEDDGVTWKNNDGTVVANANTNLRITKDSPGITVVPMDRSNSLMNQQGQTVDLEGNVHALMWHRRDEPEFAYQPGDRFEKSDSAYFHYHRDPDTMDWTGNQLLSIHSVGSRPKIGHDANGDLYAVYTNNDGYLIVAGATSDANFADWSILYDGLAEGGSTFASEPLIDQARLLEDGVLSVFVQEGALASTNPAGSALHVLEFNVAVIPEPSSLTLLAIAGIGVVARRRRKS